MSLFRGAAITGGLTLVSRVLGFIRDLLVARLFGASPLADAYFVAFRIPNLLRSFVAEGALNSAFVPVFVGKIKEGQAARNSSFRQALGFACVLAGSLTLVGMYFAPELVALMAPGFQNSSFQGSAEKATLTVELTRIMFPLLVCVSIVAAVGGALNSLKIFGAPAMAQIVMNIALILGALAAAQSSEPIFILAWSVLIGGVAQVISQIPALRRAELPLTPTLRWEKNVIVPIAKLLLPATLGAAVYQALIFLATVFASLIGDGAVSWLFYADRLTQLPIGIFSIALASVLLPMLARARADVNAADFNVQLVRSLRWTSFVLIPMSLWLWLDAEALVRILFERGSFKPHDTAMTAAAVRGLTLGLWAMSCQSMVIRAFIASHDTKTPSLLGIFSLVTYVISAFLCVAELRGFVTPVLGIDLGSWSALLPSLGHVGLATSSSIATLLSFFICLFIALRRFSGLKLGTFLRGTFSAVFCSCISGLVFVLVLQSSSSLNPIIAQCLALLALCSTHLLALFITRSAELSEITAAISTRYHSRIK